MEDDAKIRNHANRAGDADTHNEYEHVKKGDDESIDDDGSEVGWDSEDEQVFHSTSQYQKKKSSKRSQPDSDDEDYDEDASQDGGILLSDILFRNIEAKAKGIVLPNDQDSDDDEDEEDDEDEDEDEGSNSDNGSGSEEEDDIDEVHSRLLDAIDRFSKPQSGSSGDASSKKRSSNQNAAESAYSSVLNNGDVSMNALLGALDDTRGLGVVKKHLADLEKGLAAPVHVEKVVADRMERTQVYAGSKEEMNKWQGTVVANRHVGTLDLAKDKRQVRSFKSMLNRFEPTTDMEKEIQMILVKNGANDEDAAQREVDELQGRNMSLQEIREKQAELAKVKALMFYDQMKRHRLNKIKSKAYRKIQKKKKLKKGESAAEDLDEEEDGEKKEKDAYNRVKERMDLRHKNTSKWARMAIQYGHTDKSLRDAYHESVQLGQELTNKMNEELQDDARSAGSGSDGEDGSDGDEDKTSRREVSNRASRAIASLLSENLTSSSGGNKEVPEGRYKKLFEMDFMKRAAEQQKEKARADAQSILREIEGMEEEYDSDLGQEEAEAAAKRGPQISSERLAAAKLEVKGMLGGGMNLGALGRRKGAVITDSINLNKAASNGASPFEFEYGEEEHSDDEEHAEMEQALENNPWLQPVASVSGSKKRKSSGTGAKSAANEQEEVFINTLEMQSSSSSKAPAGKKAKGGNAAPVAAASSATAPAAAEKKSNKKGPSGVIVEAAKEGVSQEKKEKPAVKIALSEGHSQADLVQMAFAGPDLEAEFAAFKKQEIDSELGIDEKKMKILSDGKRVFLWRFCVLCSVGTRWLVMQNKTPSFD